MNQNTKKLILDYLYLMESQGLQVSISYPNLGGFSIDLADVFDYMEDSLGYIAKKMFEVEKSQLELWMKRNSYP